MLPALQIGPVSLPTYPLAVLLALWAGLAVAARFARQQGINGDIIWNAGTYGLLAAVAVGRMAHVIVFWHAYRLQPLDVIGLNGQAFLWGPGAVAGCAVAAWYALRNRLPGIAMLDAVAPGILTGLIIANLGALLAGSGVGAPSRLPWAVHIWGVARHPVQLYAASGEIIALAAVVWASRRGSARGIPALLALFGWGLTTWLIEPLRAPEGQWTTAGGLRVVQIAGFLAAIAALLALQRRAGNAGRAP